LEADLHESPEVAEWAKKQNEIARKHLDASPQRLAMEKRLTELRNFERYSPPFQKGVTAGDATPAAKRENYGATWVLFARIHGKMVHEILA
jgi:prolyl oligopeptidase PreP (S9A serine peptidase family)